MGSEEGLPVGSSVGSSVGELVGFEDGLIVGSPVGSSVGILVGFEEGSSVGPAARFYLYPVSPVGTKTMYLIRKLYYKPMKFCVTSRKSCSDVGHVCPELY